MMTKQLLNSKSPVLRKIVLLGRRLFSSDNAPTTCQKTLGVLGVPFCKGQPKSGTDLAPDFLREKNIIKTLENVSNGHLLIKDYGNLEYNTKPNESLTFPNMKNHAHFLEINRALSLKIQQILKECDQFLNIGGDHSIGFGSVAGHLQHTPNLSVVWVDAHADINLPVTSGSGNTHGMPVSFLISKLRNITKNRSADEIAPKCLSPDQLFYIGLRDVDPYEAYILKKLNICAFSMDLVDKLGMTKVLEIILDKMAAKNKIHISFDIDAIDKLRAPSTGTAVDGGLTLREGLQIIETLRDTNRVQGMDMVEVNPCLGSKDDVELTTSACVEVLKMFCDGHLRSGYCSNVDENIFKMD